MKKLPYLAAIALLLCIPVGGCAKNTDAPVPPDDQEEQPLPPNEETPPELPSEPETPDLPSEPENPPTQPEPPAVRYDTLVASKVDGLRVRKGRGTSYAAVGTLDQNDMAALVERKGDWFTIRYLGGIAYVSAAYCREVTFEKSTETIESVIETGKTLLGYPYVYGAQRYHWGNGVKNTAFDGKSYDCSSLTQYMYKLGANVNLATTSREQSLQGVSVAKSNLRRGDLIFFTNASRYDKVGLERIGHVALYLGDNMLLHTASDHAVIEPISTQRWNYYISACRFIN